MVTWGGGRERAVLAGRSALFAKGQIWLRVAGHAGFLKGCYEALAVTLFCAKPDMFTICIW